MSDPADAAPPSGAFGPRSRYSLVAIVLHWLIAALILANIGVGWRMSGLKGLAQFELFQLHKSIGVTVLLLSLLRIAWRLVNKPPRHATALTPVEQRASSIVHGLLYAFILAVPLTGWVVVSASAYNLPTVLFGVAPWPHLAFVHDLPTALRKLIDTRVGALHQWLAWSMLALAGVHAAAALKHHLWDRDDVLARMAPLPRRRPALNPEV